MVDGDAALVGRVLAGETGAFGTLVERYQDAVFGVALSQTGSVADADEVYGEGQRYDVSLECADRCRTWFVPLVTHALGIWRTVAASEVQVFNPGRDPVSVDLWFTPTGSDGPASRRSVAVDVGAGETWQTEDVVGHVFGETGPGSLEIDAHGDEVIVVPGVYREDILLQGKNILLTSTDPESPDTVASTIIDGNEAGPVVTFSGTEESTCTVSGFTIRNGSAEYGGGICGGTEQDHTHATIVNNSIAGNAARSRSKTPCGRS